MKLRKILRLRCPTQLSTQRQWWSIRRTHLPHLLQWCVRGGLTHLHFGQYFMYFSLRNSIWASVRVRPEVCDEVPDCIRRFCCSAGIVNLRVYRGYPDDYGLFGWASPTYFLFIFAFSGLKVDDLDSNSLLPGIFICDSIGCRVVDVIKGKPVVDAVLCLSLPSPSVLTTTLWF